MESLLLPHPECSWHVVSWMLPERAPLYLFHLSCKLVCGRLQGDRGEGWAAGVRFLLGGSYVHNSKSFLSMLSELQAREGHF